MPKTRSDTRFDLIYSNKVATPKSMYINNVNVFMCTKNETLDLMYRLGRFGCYVWIVGVIC